MFLGSRGIPVTDNADIGKTLWLGFSYAIVVPLLGLAAGWLAHANM